MIINKKIGENSVFRIRWFFILILFIFILQFENISAKEIFIDKNIEEQFNQNKEWVDIFFIPENSLETDKLISDFRQDELEVSRKSSRWIVARITKEGFNKLAKDTRIKEIFFNSPVQGTLDTSAPLINATKVWNDFNFTGKGIKICIIDSGVNKSQPYLANKIVEEYCYCSAPDSLLSSNDCCPDGTAEDNKAEDYYGHGTHVTGIIASQDSTYRGIAYNASIYEVKVLNSSNKGALVDIGDAIDWCRINASADVISISIGDGLNHPGASVCPYFLDGTINDAYNANISIIVASGNEEYITGMNYPACSPNVISVGSTTKSDDMSWFTNRPTDLDLLAPGESIISLRWDPHAVMPGCLEASNQFMICSGTSQATPHVAGAAALLLERDTTLTPDEIRQILRDTAKNITTNWKRIDVLAAINSLCTCTSWTAGSCGSAGGCSLNERKYTRTCSPSACDIESECRAESSCLPSTGPGIGITVCASGCNYTTINNAIGIKIISSSNNTFRNINIKTSGSSAFGIDLYGLSDNNLFYDSIINASHALSNNTYFESNAIGILNFTNVTSAYKKTDFGANSNARLNVHWYFEAEVKNSTGYQVANANVSAWDKNNLLRFSALTNADGNISKQTLIEYMQNATKKTYYTNYIINATKNDSTASQSINLTANMFKTFILPITIILNASNIKEDGYAEYYNSIYSRNNLSTTAYIGYPYYMDRGYVEFNTSLIPDNANITKVILNLSMSSIMSSIYCDINPIETRPSIASNTNLYNDAGNGTAYINNDNFCSTKYYPSLNLGSNANNDLKNLLSSNWFAVGIRTDPESASKYASFYTSESSASPILIVSYT